MPPGEALLRARATRTGLGVPYVPRPCGAPQVVRQQKKGAQNITVAVRVRPLTKAESGRHAYATTKVLDHEHVLVSDPDDKMGGLDYLRLDKTRTKHYCFDHSFGPEAAQAEVYAQTAKELVPRVVEGYNACCFAYGATRLTLTLA